MTDGFVRVGTVTPTVKVGNPKANVQAHIACAREAAQAGVKVLVFPELSLTAYTCGDLFFQKSLREGAVDAILTYAEATKDLDMISFVGAPIEWENALYNCAVAIGGGEILGVVPKSNLPSYGEFSEGRYFTAPLPFTQTITLGGRPVTFGTEQLFICEEMPDLSICAEICEDIWVSWPPSSRHTGAGATLVVNLSASPEAVGKVEKRRNLITSQAQRCTCAYVYANCGKGESGTDLVFSAHALICQGDQILAERPPFSQKELLIAEVDLERVRTERLRLNVYPTYETCYYKKHAFSLKTSETPLSRLPEKLPFVPKDPRVLEERCRLISQMQSHALAGRASHVRAKSLVLGLSGGLDSTLALLVAVKAADLAGLDRKQVIAVTMPGFGTTGRTRENARIMAECLGVTLRTVNICASVSQHFSDIGHDPEKRDVVYENSQARERTQVLMDLANAEGGLVVGTGDLSELALGWATYNGDHMSMYGVNADLPKTLMRYLVAFEADLAESQGDELLARTLRDVVDTPVSPELLPPNGEEIAQQTEDLVGPYELHDFFLYYFLRYGFSPRKILRLAVATFADQYDADTVRGWLKVFLRRFFNQQFKRSCLPDGPKMGSVGLSPRGAWQMPSDADSALWLDSLL